MKRHKEPLNAPTRNGEAQVFVLPPDLLEKLGIQLSNITCPTGGLAENSTVDHSTKDAEDILSSVDGSSILETANLMKQSVFMSPTFVSTAVTDTTNELNLHNILSETTESIQDDNKQFIVKNVIDVNNADKIGFNEDINPSYNKTLASDSFEKYQSVKQHDVEDGDLIQTDVSYETVNKANIDLSSNKISNVDDHADEAYSSDGSNSNSGTCSESTNNNLEPALKRQQSSNKIKILSEQIINHSDFNTIQNSRIQKRNSSCFLIPVNTILTGKTTKDLSNNQQQTTVQEELCSTPEIISNVNNKIGKEAVTNDIYVEDSFTEKHSGSKVPGRKTDHEELFSSPGIKTKDNNKIGNLDFTNNVEIDIHEDTLIEDLLNVKHSESIIPGVMKEETTSHKIKTNNYSGNKSGMFLDIDTNILSNEDNKIINHCGEVNRDEKPKIKEANDTTKEIVSNTDKVLTKSKLCIQGVEKPGGTHENKTNTVLKTYKRTNIRKCLPELPRVDSTNIEDTNILFPKDVIKDLNNINMDGYKNENQFCICSDFGLLSNDDCDVVYEHIHFRDHNSVGCNLETLFSMYDDTTALPEWNITKDINLVNDDIENTQHNICWLSFISENDDEIEEIAIIEPKITDEPNLSTGEPRRSIRKRKSTATEHVLESVELKSKNTVKCGHILSEAEWNRYKDSEHNLIALKDGQAIVENISTTTESETLSKDALEKKDTTPKITQSTRRSSRNLNLGIEVSDISLDNSPKSKINEGHINATPKKLKSTGDETDLQCKSKKSATSNQIETPTISKRKSNQTSSNLVEKDGVTSKSTSKSVDVVSSEPTRKVSGLGFSHSHSPTSVVSCSEPLVKSLDAERSAKCTRQSKTFAGTIKSTDNEVTSKQKKMSFDLSSKPAEIRDNPKAEVKGTPKSTRRTSDGSSNDVKHKETPKVEVKGTPKSTRKSIDVVSKTTEVIGTTKSIRRSINVDITTKSNLARESEAISKATRKSIDIAVIHPKSTLKAKDVDVSSKSNSMPVDASNKSTRVSAEAVGVSAKSIRKPTNVETPSTSTRTLEEIDLFSSPTIAKTTRNESQPKSYKQSKNVLATAKPLKVETTPKPTSSTDVPSKRTRKSVLGDDSNKLTKKSIDSDASSVVNRKSIVAESKGKEVDGSSPSAIETTAKSNRKSSDAHASSKVPRQFTRDKDSKNSSLTPLKETINYIPSKSKIQFEDPLPSKAKKRCSDMIKSEAICEALTDAKNDINLPSRKKSNVSILRAEKNPAQSAKTDTSDNATALQNNTQEVDVTSGSISGNNEVNSSSKINPNSSSEDSEQQAEEEIYVISIKEEILPKCGVCNKQVEEVQWLEHIAKEHDYLAWREDEPPLDLEDDDEVRGHLYAIVKAHGPLKCSKCDLTRKYAKSFLTHIRSCNGIAEEQCQMDASAASDMDTTHEHDDIPLSSYQRPAGRNAALQRSVICGVCNETVLENKWIDHIRIEHKYLAWKKGEPPVDVNDDVAVKIFLQNISKYNGGLICSKCGTVRSYVKKWMDHEAVCKGNEADESSQILDESTLKEAELVEIEILPETVKCAKCGKEMPSKTWIDHIEKEHNYLSWIEGYPPLEESNPEAVSAYLHALVKKRGMLYCAKCGVTRKYPKAFLTHISACEISGFKREDFYVEVSGQSKPGEYECAVCHETGPLEDWKKHAMSKHYNVAWMAGDIPINLKNPYAVEKYIKEYRTKHNLICNVCGASRASCYGFYAHILTCGKTEEELEHLMEMCDVCNNKFLCIYRNQHRAMHKEQMIKKEKKERDAIRAEEECIARAKAKDEEGQPMGKRRAAEKAKKVMERYTSNIQDGSHTCPSCHIEFDNDTQLKDHKCQSSKVDDGSDSEVSLKMEGQEESDDDMEDIDSSISDEEADPLKRKRPTESIPKITLPFKVKDFNYYLAKSYENFCELHYTSERLFNNWQSNDYRILSEEESAKYLPSLSESCKIRFLEDQWVSYKRFEARKKKDITIFTGATVRCMQWVPHRITQEVQDNYLSVVCFPDADCPRYGKDELPEHPGMMQIWNIGRFTSIPKFVMGLVHDYGTIWAMDWCPSGARENLWESEDGCRLGLLAIACSNGCAYILSVPWLYTEAQDKPIICKLKPAAELRLSANPKQPPFRMGYQATSISWSPQKGHDVVLVGYADGTTALYDLNTESPFLRANEDGVDIFYPFQDAHAENSTITGVALCASGDLHRVVGGLASSSVTGATMASWPRGPVVRSHLAASSVSYMPNWPAALLCSDDVLTVKSTNEMEWWGGGRRLGGACAAGACARCGRVCLTAPPFVRVLRAHPAYPELKKQIVATMKMIPIARKRKLVNDDLGMILEPLTYDEAIKKYGLEFKILPKKDQYVASKLCDKTEQCAERFPLSDMPAAAFCTSAEHHNRLAIASHAGFIFIITT